MGDENSYQVRLARLLLNVPNPPSHSAIWRAATGGNADDNEVCSNCNWHYGERACPAFLVEMMNDV